jgi:hypothetical protein
VRIALVLIAALASATTASAAPIFFDDFEAYASTAAMSAPGAWGDLQDPGETPLGFLDFGPPLGFGNPGQSMAHDGGETNRHAIAPLTSGAGAIIWEFDFFSVDLATNRRVTGGLRVDNGVPLLEMGIYNSTFDPDDPFQPAAGFAIRTVGIGGPTESNGWLAFPGNPSVEAGWHHFRATIGTTSILFELDLGDDGAVDASRLVNTDDISAVGWNSLRIGGPSDLSSMGFGANFDNYGISQIPEPGTLSLVAMGLGGLLLRRLR